MRLRDAPGHRDVVEGAAGVRTLDQRAHDLPHLALRVRRGDHPIAGANRGRGGFERVPERAGEGRGQGARLTVGLGVTGQPEHRGGERPGREPGDEREAAGAQPVGEEQHQRAEVRGHTRLGHQRSRDLELVLVVVGAGGQGAEAVVAADDRSRARAGCREPGERGGVRHAQVVERADERAHRRRMARDRGEHARLLGQHDARGLEPGFGGERDPIGFGEERSPEQLGDPVQREEPAR